MRPLRALVLVKDRPLLRAGEGRNMGAWSYAVPEFTWQYATFGNGFLVNRDTYADQGYDFVFHEDGGNWGTWEGDRRLLPVVYHAIDSTLSERHLAERRKQAAASDLCLVEHDNPDRFIGVGVPIRRLPYAVNDHLFQPQDKTLDILCAQGRNPERKELEAFIVQYAAARGLRAHVGPLALLDYADAMGRAKVVVCKPRVRGNRPHRVFDAMASGALLVTGELPLSAKWDGLLPAIHYLDWHDIATLELCLDTAFSPILRNNVERTRENGHAVVMERHTWAVRAGELRMMLGEVFPWLA